jgi:hypothetical protein
VALTLSAPELGTRKHAIVSVGTSPTLLAAKNTNRKALWIQNQGAAAVFIGLSTVSTGRANQGFSLAVGATFTDQASADE